MDDLLREVYDFHEYPGPGRMTVGPFDIDMALTNHPVETYAMRIMHGGKSITYSADTGICDDLPKLARETDLFLCEASYLEGEDNPPDIHLTGKEAGEYAARADVGQLVLTHLVAWGDRERTLSEATAAYDGEISVACTEAVYEI